MTTHYDGPVLLTGQTIRDGDPQDIAELMWHLSGGKTRPRLNKFDCEVILAPGAVWPVIRVDGRIVSMAIMTPYRLCEYPDKRFGFVNDVSTHPDYRSRGFGRLVMNKIFEVGVRDKYAHIDWTSSKFGAQRFYESDQMKCAGVQRRVTNVYRWTATQMADPAAAI